MGDARAPVLYRLLLRAFPRGFRERFGEGMEALFVERLRDAGGSPRARFAVWARGVADVLAHAAAERLARLRRTRAGVDSDPGAVAPGSRRRAAFLPALLREMRHAVRGLLRAPGYAAVAIVTLSLGLGASTAIYTLLDRVVLSPLPYPESDRLVRLKTLAPGVGPGTEWNISPTQFFFFGEQSRTIERIGAYARWGGGNMATPSGPEFVVGANVSAGLLYLIGARPVVGRLMDERDGPRDAPVIVLSHGFWQRRFGGDPGVVGTTLGVHGVPHDVIGVMAPGIELPPEPGGGPVVQTDIWSPIHLDPGVMSSSHVIPAIARLRPGISPEEAQAELDRLTARLREVFPETYTAQMFERLGLRTQLYVLKPYVLGDLARSVWVVFGGVGLVLLIACANVANLFLVRVEARRRDLAIRGALGAGRNAIARHLLAESLVLSIVSGALALLIGYAGLRGVVAFAADSLPRIADLRLDGGVLLFTIALSLLVAIALTAVPLAQHGKPGGAGSLLEGGRSMTAGRARQRVRSALVVLQVAFALVLLTGAGLLIESSRRLRAVDPGIDATGVITAGLYLPSSTYGDPPAMWRFYQEVLQRVRALAGVTEAGMSSELPFTGGFGCTSQRFEDREVNERLSASGLTACAGQDVTTPGFFEAMGIPLVRGRLFDDADNAGTGVGAVIVSRSFAERFWPDEDPIGKGVAPPPFLPDAPFHRVVGVVGDVYSSSVVEEPAIVVYYPVVLRGVEPWRPGAMQLAVRTADGDLAAMLPAIRSAIASVDPSIPLANVESMRTLVDRAMSRVTFVTMLLGLAASFALLLAAVGLFGVISYIVTLRTGEIGVRMALGALPRRVQADVIGGSLRLTAIGLGLGILAAIAATRVLSSLLYGIEATDPLAYTAAALLLAGVATLASAIPARRASRIDPVRALQQE